MKKALLLLFVLIATGLPLTFARERFKMGKEERKEVEQETKRNERSKKIRMVFISKIRGRRLVFLRLSVGQFISQKFRAKLRRGKGMIRIVLRLRQLRLLRKILKKEGIKMRPKIIIRVPARVAKKGKLKAIYVVRPASFFVKGRDEDLVEDNPVLAEEK